MVPETAFDEQGGSITTMDTSPTRTITFSKPCELGGESSMRPWWSRFALKKVEFVA